MSQFAEAVRSRVDSARRSALLATANDDPELASLHEADLLNLERLAREHGVDIGGEHGC